MITLHHGDCREVMATMPAESVDAIVCDPPYGLSFMGKEWDHGVPGVAFWVEALRVAKPGAHLLAFGGTRTFHRLAVAIEDAGWEIRDTIMWVYGSGFPKSLDVGKAIDKRGGGMPGFEEFRDAVKTAMQRNGVSRQRLQDALGNFMLSHYLTAGSQPAVPVLRDYRIIRDTVGLGHQFDELFNDEAEREVVGQRRIGDVVAWYAQAKRGDCVVNITAPATDAACQWDGWGTALKPAWEPIIVARKPCVGTVAENVLRYGTGGINVDGCRVGTEGGTTRSEQAPYAESGWRTGHDVLALASGRWPANVIHDGSDEVVGLFPVTGASGSPSENGAKSGGMFGFGGADRTSNQYYDIGSAARFFYCAKASPADRDDGCEGLEERRGGSLNTRTNAHSVANNMDTGPRHNHHPTVKPTELMRYLCRMVTPPGGVVLDPFCGSGSTGRGAVLEGASFIGIDLDAEYLEIARCRINACVTPIERIISAPAARYTPELPRVQQMTMFAEV